MTVTLKHPETTNSPRSPGIPRMSSLRTSSEWPTGGPERSSQPSLLVTERRVRSPESISVENHVGDISLSVLRRSGTDLSVLENNVGASTTPVLARRRASLEHEAAPSPSTALGEVLQSPRTLNSATAGAHHTHDFYQEPWYRALLMFTVILAFLFGMEYIVIFDSPLAYMFFLSRWQFWIPFLGIPLYALVCVSLHPFSEMINSVLDKHSWTRGRRRRRIFFATLPWIYLGGLLTGLIYLHFGSQ